MASTYPETLTRVNSMIGNMADRIDPADLINAEEVAQIIGLTNSRGVSVYRARHESFPIPIVEKGQCVLWLRSDVEAWAASRSQQ